MTKTLLLFDIDGTIMLSGGAGLRAMRIVAGRMFGPSFSWDGVSTAGRLDPEIFADVARRNGISDHERHHDAFREHYVRQLRIELQTHRDAIVIMPGILKLLELLRRRAQDQGDIMLGLLTGNYAAAAPLKLESIGTSVSWFAVTAFGDEADSRPDLLELAMRKYQAITAEPADPGRIIVIGDTPLDVQCARTHGCIAFAVATGFHSADELRQAGSDVVAQDLSDPAPLLTLIDEPSSPAITQP